jgi:hypothetical protein
VGVLVGDVDPSTPRRGLTSEGSKKIRTPAPIFSWTSNAALFREEMKPKPEYLAEPRLAFA